MEYGRIGRTGLFVSEICLGTPLYGREVDEAESISILHGALDLGVNFFDTANWYADWRS